MSTVLVVQHAEKLQAPGDPGLTALGREQAAMTASWLAQQHPYVSAVWSSPLARARETAGPIADAFGLDVQVEPRLRERMNWDDGAAMTNAEFLREWQRATADREYEPSVGDSSTVAAERFIAALIDIAQNGATQTLVAVAHGGVTVDALRSIAGDARVHHGGPSLITHGIPCCAITTLEVEADKVTVSAFPSAGHLQPS